MPVMDLLARAKNGEGVKSGPLGLAVILVLCVAMYFLFKSMSKHLKRVREEFPSASRRSRPVPKVTLTPGADDTVRSGRLAAVDGRTAHDRLAAHAGLAIARRQLAALTYPGVGRMLREGSADDDHS